MRESLQTGLSRGRRSRNKVSVGEPAEGSFQQQSKHKNFLHRVLLLLGALRYYTGFVRFGSFENWIRSFSKLFEVVGSSKLSFLNAACFRLFFFHTNFWIWIPT
jgi:hypothetical protein